LVTAVERLERAGIALSAALRAVSLDAESGWLIRGLAARLFAIADGKEAVSCLIGRFFAQTEKIELWETALTIEWFGDRAAVRLLIPALRDQNPHRRHAAARALGWIPGSGSRAAKALIETLLDHTQPQPVREEAAESLAYLDYPPAIPALISVLGEPDVRIRFWAVFALGSKSGSPRVVAALERMLPDEEVTPGNWWSVGREALAMLARLEPEYQVKLEREIRRVFDDPNSSPEDRRWAKGDDLQAAPGSYTIDET
jgi:HEAT repeat protein